MELLWILLAGQQKATGQGIRLVLGAVAEFLLMVFLHGGDANQYTNQDE